jgi:hypothetical protein
MLQVNLHTILLGYGKNVAKGMASDQQQGYFGAFGGGTGKFDVNAGQLLKIIQMQQETQFLMINLILWLQIEP